ncbi:unnamed protein product [Caenorhabditis nigoni]
MSSVMQKASYQGEDSEYFLKIHPVLQCLLNSESQQNLMNLDISGVEGSFSPRWIGSIQPIDALAYKVRYRVAVAARDDVTFFGPTLPNPPSLHASDFHDVPKIYKRTDLDISSHESPDNETDSGTEMESTSSTELSNQTRAYSCIIRLDDFQNLSFPFYSFFRRSVVVDLDFPVRGFATF